MGKTPQSLFMLDASRAELTLLRVEISFASGIHSRNHFHQLASVIVGLAHKLIVEHIPAGSEVLLKSASHKGGREKSAHLLSLQPTKVRCRAAPNGSSLLRVRLCGRWRPIASLD